MATTRALDIEIRAQTTGQEAVEQMAESVDRLGREATQTGQQSTQAAQGVDALGNQAGQAAQGVNRAGQAASDTSGRFVDAAGRLREANGQFVRTDESARGAAKGLGIFGQELDAIEALVSGALVQQLVSAMAQMENLAMGLAAVAQDGKAAGEQLDFVKRMANAAGVDILETGKAFLSLQASTKGTAVEGKVTSDVFEAVTVSMAKAGKTSAETALALQALGQMAGKGTVQMEELRGQLGEALPGAMQAAARGMGITGADLTKLVESGKVAAEDIFPALTKGLRDLYGTAPDAQTLGAEITNLKNAFTEFAANLGDAGVGGMFKGTLEYLQLALLGFENTIIVTGKQIGIFAAALATMDFSGFANAITEVEQEAQDKVGRMAEHNSLLQNAMGITAEQARQMSKSLREAGDATKKAGEEAAGAGTGYIGITNAYEKLYDELNRYIDVAKKEVELSKATGDAAVAKARMLGDEAEVRKAVAESAKAQAAALVTLAERQQADVDAIRAELEEKRRLLAAEGPISDQRQKQLKELEDLIVKKQVEAATTAQQAAKAQDHAKAVSEETLRLQDAVKNTEALTAVKRTQAQTNLMGLETQLKLAQSSEDLARIIGNETGVSAAKITQMEIEIKITKAKAEVQEIEARGSIAVAQAKLEELKASNQLTPLKKAELNASIKLAEAKIAEAQAMGKSTEATEELLRRIKNGTVDFEKFGNTGAGAFGQIATGAATANAAMQQQQDHLDLMMTKYQQSYQYSERAIELLEKQAAATEKLAEAERKRLNVDKEGFSLNTAGQRIEAVVQTPESIRRQLIERGVDEAQAEAMSDRLARQWQEMAAGTSGGLLGGFINMTNPKSWDEIMKEAVQGARKPLGRTPTRTVNVNLNQGGRRVTATVPEGDEQRFLGMLDAARRVS